MFARQRHARRAHHGGDRELHVPLQRQELQLGFVELEPLALVAEPVTALEETPDDAHGLVLPVPQHHGIDAEGVGVGR